MPGSQHNAPQSLNRSNVSVTQSISASTEKPPISAAVAGTGNSCVFPQTLRVPKTDTGLLKNVWVVAVQVDWP